MDAATGESAPTGRRPGRRRRGDALAVALLGIGLAAGLAAGGTALYQSLYSPSAFVGRYLDLIAEGRAADALAVPGVTVSSAELADAGLPTSASDALLRAAAMTTLTDVTVTGEKTVGDVVRVSVDYRAGRFAGSSVFEVRQAGWIGPVPAWRFAESPLAVVDLTVRGSMQFAVNGFEVDKRQVSPEGDEVDPLAPVPLLVFSPGLYTVDVGTAVSTTPSVPVLADAPLAAVSLDLQTEPTDAFVDVVQQRVEEFLSACTTQVVLQPTGCPFGYVVQNRIVDPPTWSIVAQPTVAVVPDGAGWAIPAAEAVAHIEVKIRSLFDGSIREVSEDVPFTVTGTIDVLPDGAASIRVGGAE